MVYREETRPKWCLHHCFSLMEGVCVGELLVVSGKLIKRHFTHFQSHALIPICPRHLCVKVISWEIILLSSD